LRQQQDGTTPPAQEKAEPKSGRRLRGLAKRAEAIAELAETGTPAAKTEATSDETVAAPPEAP